MGNVESVPEKFKNFSCFSDENWPEVFFGKNYDKIQLNWVLLHQLMQKYYHLEAYCKVGTQKCAICPLKCPRIETLIANNSPKKVFAGPKLGIW